MKNQQVLTLPAGTEFTLQVACSLGKKQKELVSFEFRVLADSEYMAMWKEIDTISEPDFFFSILTGWDFYMPFNKWHVHKFIEEYPQAYLEACKAYGDKITGGLNQFIPSHHFH